MYFRQRLRALLSSINSTAVFIIPGPCRNTSCILLTLFFLSKISLFDEDKVQNWSVVLCFSVFHRSEFLFSLRSSFKRILNCINNYAYALGKCVCWKLKLMFSRHSPITLRFKRAPNGTALAMWCVYIIRTPIVIASLGSAHLGHTSHPLYSMMITREHVTWELCCTAADSNPHWNGWGRSTS